MNHMTGAITLSVFPLKENLLQRCKRMLSWAARIAIPLFLVTNLMFAASWTFMPRPQNAPGNFGTMVLLSDGSVMMVDSANNKDWWKFEPDGKGDYTKGSFRKIAPMSIGRLYFASQVLPNGNFWVLGGEYTGPYGSRNDTNSSEIYDTVNNKWSAIAPYPNVSGCGTEDVKSDANLVAGDTKLKGIFSTFGMQPGWAVTGTGIPAGAIIASVDSDHGVSISAAASITGTTTAVDFTGNAISCFGATPSIQLPGGKRILAGSLIDSLTYEYDVAADAWSVGAAKFYSKDRSDEEGWGKLADEKVVTYDISQSISTGAGYAEAYDPATKKWNPISPSDGTANGTLPLLSSSALGNETGS